jgi:hypothetical protein
MDQIQGNAIGRRNPSEPQEGQGAPPMRLSRKRAAMYIEAVFGIPMSTSKLSKLACSGDGPPYELFGVHPVYLPSNIDSWAAAQIGPLVHSTAAYAPKDYRKGRPGRPSRRVLERFDREST